MDARPVTILAAGGTIASTGKRAVPFLDADALVRAVPALRQLPDLRAQTVLSLPGAQITAEQALELARRATAEAGDGRGVVLSTGTDTLEELAVLAALLHDGEAPIVLTGANRPASQPGADGPANLHDAVAVAGAPAIGGTMVVFAGEIHDAMTVTKLDSTGPAAFGSPGAGPLGRVVEGRVWLHARPAGAPPTLHPRTLEHRVPIITAALGDDGALIGEARADGLVLVALGAGHLPPGMVGALRRRAAEIPVLLTCRTHRAAMLRETYGFEGSEQDLRRSGAIATPLLSAPAARMALLCCLGAGLGRDEIAEVLAPYDA